MTPFPEDDPALTVARLAGGDAPKRPRAIDPSIPENVEAVIQSAMARSPDERPANAMELRRPAGSAGDPRGIRAAQGISARASHDQWTH